MSAGNRNVTTRTSFLMHPAGYRQTPEGQRDEGVRLPSVLIREATSEEVIRWDEHVSRFDNCRMFHTLAWIRSIAAFSGAKPLFLMVEKHGEIAACLPGFLVKIALLCIFASPREGWQTGSMGPVFDPNNISTQELFEALIPFLEQKYRVHHIELACAGLDGKVMDALGFRGESKLTYRVQLFPDEAERVIKNMRSRTRSYVRASCRRGLVGRVESDESFVDEVYDQLHEVYTRKGNAVPFGKNRVVQLFRHMKESNNLLALSVRKADAHACLAAGVYLVDGKELYLWSWSHRTQHNKEHPIEFLTWTAMQKALQAGCLTFDMGGGGQAKLKYGAFPDRTVYRWLRSRYRWLAWIREQLRGLYRLQQFIRGQMSRAWQR